jgi:hypothetical protein
MKNSIKKLLPAIYLFAALTVLALSQTGNVYGGTDLYVNSNSDNTNCDGVLTLREAMLLAAGQLNRSVTNEEKQKIQGAWWLPGTPCAGFSQSYWTVDPAGPGPAGFVKDFIHFENNVTLISPTSALPDLIRYDSIFGTNGLILDGSNAPPNTSGLAVREARPIDINHRINIQGLTIRNFQGNGIVLFDGAEGVGLFGLKIHNNRDDGIAFYAGNGKNPRDNRIGAATTLTGFVNYIYSNGRNGITIAAWEDQDRSGSLNNSIEGNFIGLDTGGNTDLGNGQNGIVLQHAFGNRIGSENISLQRNVVSGNNNDGIQITGNGAVNNRVINTNVGTNAAGNQKIGNSASGIALLAGAGAAGAPNYIGELDRANIIGGNGTGVFVGDAGTTHNVINGNYIGTNNAAVVVDLGNNGDGVHLTGGASTNYVGAATGIGNVIAYNSRGVAVASGTQNTIRGNQIYSNDGLGIDLLPAGVTPNDNSDGDTGANNLQNFPVVGGASVSPNGQTVTISGSLNSTPSQSFTIDFYTTASCDAGNYGEGFRRIASLPNVNTDFAGNSLPLLPQFPMPPGGILNFVTATATNQATGDTSEFSQCVAVTFQSCTYALSSTNTSIPQSGGSGSFNVSTQTGCAWSATSNVAWITTTSSGTGGGTVSFTVAANTGAARSGTITVGGQTFTVNQAGSCTYSLPASSASVSNSGGTFAASINAIAGCSWAAVSNVGWVTTSSTGSGNGIFQFTVQPNTGAARSGTITVGGQTFTITQASGCTYSLNPLTSSVPATLGTGTFAITTQSGCSWTAVSNVSWITTNSSGTGTGTVTFSYQSNLGPARSGTIIVGGQTFTVNQANGCNYMLSANSVNVSAVAGSGSVIINTATGCTWTATSNASWITSNSSGSGSGTISFSYQANTGPARSGTITVGGQTFTVNQAATGCTYGITPTTSSVSAAAGTGSFSIGTISGCAWSAVSNVPWITTSSSGTLSGSIIYNYQANTGPARSGTITVGGQTFTLNQAAATAVRTRFDFDGDGKSDVSVFRPSNGAWYLLQSQNGFASAAFGISTDKITPADFDGDGKTDLAVYRDGTWYIQRSTLGFTGVGFGVASDIPVPADFDGDGRAELCVFRPSNGGWYIYNLTSNQAASYAFGQIGDIPVPADFDGDGKADVAVFRPSAGTWFIQRSQLGFTGVGFGQSGDKPVSADFDGDGKADPTVFRPSTGAWYLLRSQLGFTGLVFGESTDVPTAADYDGDGKADVAVFRPSTGAWYLNRSQLGFTGIGFGQSGDKPIPNAFVP